jgi:hypothetical protein
MSEPISYPKDKIVETVLNKIRARSDAGLKEYGKPVPRTDKSTHYWLMEAAEEALDLAIYLHRVAKDFKPAYLAARDEE